MICKIPPTNGTAYFHSFSLTDNYIVVTEIPLVYDVWRILGHKLFATSPEQWFYWDPNQRTRFHVIDRQNGDRLGVFTVDPFFVFHHINAFEKDGKIYLDACCFRDNTIMKQLYLQNLRSPGNPGKKKFDTPDVRRYELPLEELSGADQEKPLPKGEDALDYTSLYKGMELPRINYDEHNGKPYRWSIYFASLLDAKQKSRGVDLLQWRSFHQFTFLSLSQMAMTFQLAREQSLGVLAWLLRPI